MAGAKTRWVFVHGVPGAEYAMHHFLGDVHLSSINLSLLFSHVCRVPLIGPIPWGHSGPLCHTLSLLLLLSMLSLWTSILHCHSPGVATVARRLRYSYSWLRLILVVVSTVATPGKWQCKIRTGGVRRLALANGPNIVYSAIERAE